LQERAIEHAVLPWSERNGVALVAYSPFGHGSFPQANSQAGRVLAELAAAYQATPRQIALAFLTRHHSVFTIPKAASLAHVEENAAAATIRLDANALARLEQAFPPGRKPASLPML
jgi:diketogulonate reductase-like aldo/keto reductase